MFALILALVLPTSSHAIPGSKAIECSSYSGDKVVKVEASRYDVDSEEFPAAARVEIDQLVFESREMKPLNIMFLSHPNDKVVTMTLRGKQGTSSVYVDLWARTDTIRKRPGSDGWNGKLEFRAKVLGYVQSGRESTDVDGELQCILRYSSGSAG